MRIIILGAGIMGITSAYYLSNLGFKVTVIEKNSKSAQESSFMNGGQLSFSHTEPISNRLYLSKFLYKIICKKSTINFKFKKKNLNWILNFIKNSTLKNANKTTDIVSRLAKYSSICFKEIIKKHDINFHYKNCGSLFISRNSSTDKINNYWLNAKKNAEVNYKILDKKQHYEIDSNLKNMADIYSSIFYPDDCVGDIYKFCNAMESICINQGVEFKYNTEITSTDYNDNEIIALNSKENKFYADKFLITTGANKINIPKLDLPYIPIKGYSISYQDDNNILPNTNLLFNDLKIVSSKIGNIFRVGGMMDFYDYNYDLINNRLIFLDEIIKTLIPNVNKVKKIHEKSWSCLRAFTPNNKPLIGKTIYNNLFINLGHCNLGWTLSCGSSKIIANIIAGNNKYDNYNDYLQDIRL